MDVLERATPDIIKRYLATLTPKERVRGGTCVSVCMHACIST